LNNKLRILRDLKLIENKLKHDYNQNKQFRRFYESKHKDDSKIDKEKIVLFPEGKNIFSGIDKKTIDFLTSSDSITSILFNKEDNSFEIRTYFDLLETIISLIEIIEFELMEEGIGDII